MVIQVMVWKGVNCIQLVHDMIQWRACTGSPRGIVLRRSQLLNVNQLEGIGCSKSRCHLGIHLEDLAENNTKTLDNLIQGAESFCNICEAER